MTGRCLPVNLVFAPGNGSSKELSLVFMKHRSQLVIPRSQVWHLMGRWLAVLDRGLAVLGYLLEKGCRCDRLPAGNGPLCVRVVLTAVWVPVSCVMPHGSGIPAVLDLGVLRESSSSFSLLK